MLTITVFSFCVFVIIIDRVQDRRLPDRPPSEPEYLMPSLPTEAPTPAVEQMDDLKPFHQRNAAEPPIHSTNDSLSFPNINPGPAVPPQDPQHISGVRTLPNGNAQPIGDHQDYRDVQFKALSADARILDTLRGPVSDASEGTQPHMMTAKAME